MRILTSLTLAALITAALPAYAQPSTDDIIEKRTGNQAERREAAKEKWDALSDEQKAEIKEKSKEKWGEKEGDRAERREKAKEKWDSLSDEQKAEHKAKAKERFQHREGDKTRLDDRIERHGKRRDNRNQ